MKKNLRNFLATILIAGLTFPSYSQNAEKPKNNSLQEISYQYDALNRLVEVKSEVDTNRDKKIDYLDIIEYKYDALGNIKMLRYQTLQCEEDTINKNIQEKYIRKEE